MAADPGTQLALKNLPTSAREEKNKSKQWKKQKNRKRDCRTSAEKGEMLFCFIRITPDQEG